MPETVGRLAWHVHHDMLCERLTEPFNARVRYIRVFKPIYELDLRLRLFKLVTGPLPKGLNIYAFEREPYEKRALQDLYPQMQALHVTECPNCPWDGHTIFPW